jgi:hypothetical protein
LSLYPTNHEGIAALRRQRMSLNVDDDHKRISEKILQSSYDMLRHAPSHSGEVVAHLKSSGTCSAYIMHDGILGASLRARLRLRRTSLNYHLYRLDVMNRMPNCLYCSTTYHDDALEDASIEEADHLLLHCPQYHTIRQQFIDSMHEKEKEMDAHIAFNLDNLLCSDECITSLHSRELRKEWIHMTEKYIVSIFHVRGIL